MQKSCGPALPRVFAVPGRAPSAGVWMVAVVSLSPPLTGLCFFILLLTQGFRRAEARLSPWANHRSGPSGAEGLTGLRASASVIIEQQGAIRISSRRPYRGRSKRRPYRPGLRQVNASLYSFFIFHSDLPVR